MSRVTAATVNKELKRIGAEHRLVRGDGYYYFTEGDAFEWVQNSVYVYSADHLTLERWMEEYHQLKSEKF
jgi:hypothetical protein